MNSAKIYQAASGRTDVPSVEELEKKEAQEAAAKADAHAVRLEWLSKPQTQEFLASVLQEANELDSQARELALIAQDSINTQQIINKLVQSATLRKVISHAQKTAS